MSADIHALSGAYAVDALSDHERRAFAEAARGVEVDLDADVRAPLDLVVDEDEEDRRDREQRERDRANPARQAFVGIGSGAAGRTYKRCVFGIAFASRRIRGSS